MSDQSKLGLGKIITAEQHRDAIHVAVAPVVACGNLEPGEHVGVIGGKASRDEKPIGIVDPFLTECVRAGQAFWLFLYPGSITSLRHDWAHPSFAAEAPAVVIGDKAYSEKWLKEYVKRHCPYWGFGGHDERSDEGYSEFMRHVREERWIFYNGSDCHSLSDVEDADNLFEHLSVVLGQRITASYFEAFTCSC